MKTRMSAASRDERVSVARNSEIGHAVNYNDPLPNESIFARLDVPSRGAAGVSLWVTLEAALETPRLMTLRTVLPCLAIIAMTACDRGSQTRKPGAPEKHLPPNITQLVAFGERPAWSPDGKRIAFIGKSLGEPYE